MVDHLLSSSSGLNGKTPVNCQPQHHKQVARPSLPEKAVAYYRQTASHLMCIGVATILNSSIALAAADLVPPPPKVGNCADCIGEVETTLNVCAEDSRSCVSTYNDDETHFAAPWEYVFFDNRLDITADVDENAAAEKAVEQLIETATTGSYRPPRKSIVPPAFTALQVVEARLQGSQEAEPVPFKGVVQDRHVTEDGSQYVRVTFGLPPDGSGLVDDPSDVIDAEFVFLDADTIVDVRAQSRAEPPLKDAKYNVSLTKGFRLDYNKARTMMENLRIALGWEVTPVVSGFNADQSSNELWFEKGLQFFKGPLRY